MGLATEEMDETQYPQTNTVGQTLYDVTRRNHLDALLVIVGLGILAFIIASIFYLKKKRKEAEEAAERMRPQVFCGVCNNPNKEPGEGICEIFKYDGNNSVKLCNRCYGTYKLCKGCQRTVTQRFSIWQKGMFCRHCFEKSYRNFRDTSRAAKIYFGASCSICKSTRTLEVHHKTYIRKNHEKLEDLVVLCRSCHNIQHSKVHSGPRGGKYVIKKGRKRYVSEKEYAYQVEAGASKRSKKGG